MIKTITARELQEKVSKRKLHLFDAREKVGYVMGYVSIAVSLPLSESVLSYQTLDKDKVYHITCRSGPCSEQAAVFLSQQGYQVVNVVGGTSAWTGVLEY